MGVEGSARGVEVEWIDGDAAARPGWALWGDFFSLLADPRVPVPQSVARSRALKSNGVKSRLYVAPPLGTGRRAARGVARPWRPSARSVAAGPSSGTGCSSCSWDGMGLRRGCTAARMCGR